RRPGRLVPYEVRPTGPVDDARLAVRIPRARDAATGAAVAAEVRRIFGLDFDLSGFYRMAKSDPVLTALVEPLYGMRPTLAPTPLEMLVGSISAQQVNLQFAFACRARLVRRYGTPVALGRHTVWAFPDAATATRGRGARRRSGAGHAGGASTRASPSTTSSRGCASSGAPRAAAHDCEGRPQDPRPARPERPQGRAPGRALCARRGLGRQPRLHLPVRPPPARLHVRGVRGAGRPHAGDGVAARDRADRGRAQGDVGRRAREPLPLSGAARAVSLRGLHRRSLMEERAKRRVLAGIMLSVFLAAMESTVVATAMPTVVRSLGGIEIY